MGCCCVVFELAEGKDGQVSAPFVCGQPCLFFDRDVASYEIIDNLIYWPSGKR